MARAIVLNRFGGPEVLEEVIVPDCPPAAGEVRIRHTAIGVNFTDVHARRGDHRDLADLDGPLVLGMEAVGVVDALGAGVEQFRHGDRVAYASRPLGAYCDARNFPAERCVRVPASLTDEVVAASFLKGLTVQVLTRRVFRVESGMWVVFHSAAGGVGTLAGQWLRALGARPIGIVGSAEKARAALDNGYETVFVHGRDNWPAQIREITGGVGVPVVYDSVGRATWEESIACLAPRGHMVCFGNSSGLVPPISINLLRDRGSLWVTWVRFGDYTAGAAERCASAHELFEALADGVVRPRVRRTFRLSEAAAAHRVLERRESTGSLLLIP